MSGACSRPALVALAAAVLVAGCGGEPPAATARTLTRADSVALAIEAFDPAAFDTIAWDSAGARLERGRLVFRISCSKCHGPEGRGDAAFTLNGDTLRPPSFLVADWRFADDPEGLRRQIFSGNVAGMPYWGLVGLKYRDIDAAATFIEEELRAGKPEG